MKRLALLALLAIGCEAGEEPIEIRTGILVAIEPHRIDVHCVLQEDKTTCGCAMSECSEKAISEAVRQCNRLRDIAKIVVE